MPPILESREHKYSRYTFQLAAYGCKSGAIVSCKPSRRAWRARALQMVFTSWGTQAVVMRRLGSRSRHISVQWYRNKAGGLQWPEMQSITWLLSLMNRISTAGRVLRRSATMGGPRASTRVASAAQIPPVLSRRSHPTMAAHVAALHCTRQVCCRRTLHISELHPQSRTKPLPQPLAADAKPPSNSPQSMSSAPQESHPTLLCESMLKFHEKSRQ